MSRKTIVNKPSAVFVMPMLRAAAVLFAAGFAFVASGDENPPGGFDWLQATNGRDVFARGYATADPQQVEKFIATGHLAMTITLNGYAVVWRSGLYYSDETNRDDSKDMPASAEVISADGRRLFAAKGYKFLAPRAENQTIIIRYWRGQMGCAFVDYHLRPTKTALTITKTLIRDTTDNFVCSGN